MAHTVAEEAGIVVRRVVHDRQPERRAERVRLVASQREQRSRRAGPHPGEPVEAGAAQQVDEDRLGLVVRGVPGEDVGRQHGEPGGSCPSLQVGSVGEVDADGARHDPEGVGDGPDRVELERRSGAQTVVDVHGGGVAAGGVGEHQQGERVGTARDGARDRGARGRERAAGEQGGGEQRDLSGIEGQRGCHVGASVVSLDVPNGSAERAGVGRRSEVIGGAVSRRAGRACRGSAVRSPA
ncbi:unannotated protein [freshwater metagenome]|uniref:Unannotated protein n=1 Tax=freshwater metagenome TaxID=449393 RepID=A0A6J6CZN4_9ZZZZ